MTTTCCCCWCEFGMVTGWTWTRLPTLLLELWSPSSGLYGEHCQNRIRKDGCHANDQPVNKLQSTTIWHMTILLSSPNNTVSTLQSYIRNPTTTIAGIYEWLHSSTPKSLVMSKDLVRSNTQIQIRSPIHSQLDTWVPKRIPSVRLQVNWEVIKRHFTLQKFPFLKITQSHTVRE